jgi:anti-anti-sigma factor
MASQQQARPPVLVLVPLAAEIDVTTCEQVHDQLSTALACGAPVVIADFTLTTFCDCATLRCLLAIQRQAAAGRTEFRIAVPLASPVRRIMRMTGLDQQLRLYPTVAHAAAAPQVPAPRTPASPVRGLS